jgi:hypothetical protein
MENDDPTPLKPLRRVYSPILGVERVEFDDCKNVEARRTAEIEARRDLMKPIEQLLADVHEEAETNFKPASANKRMVSLLVRVIKTNELQAKLILVLAVIAALGTFMQVIIGILQLCHH